MREEDKTPVAIQTLREGKTSLRRERREMTLPEKVRQVVQLQRIQIKAMANRRAPTPHEKVWVIRDSHRD